jgi:hypothetical protein
MPNPSVGIPFGGDPVELWTGMVISEVVRETGENTRHNVTKARPCPLAFCVQLALQQVWASGSVHPLVSKGCCYQDVRRHSTSSTFCT